VIGLFVLAFAFAEGTGNDWIGIALIDGYGTSPAVGTLGFATFLAAMTAGRWFGPSLLDRYGRVRVIRVLTVICLVGVLLFVFGTYIAVAFAGAVLWGVGLALGFPVGMSAGADEPALAAPRVSVIASIGYCAFLAGPPLVGFLGDHYTVQKAILAVAVLLALAMLITGAVRPPVSDTVDR
jgi:MFS family permease